MSQPTQDRLHAVATVPRSSPQDLSDEDLLQRFRDGDEAAFEHLYRRHEPVARKAASCLVRSRSDTHDVVADAFTRVLAILRRGGGPDAAFRPYLLACVRNAAYDRSGSNIRELPIEELPVTSTTSEASPADPVEAAEDGDLILTALRSLPERWRLVLWYTAVEGRKPADVAGLLELSPNSVAALAYRARDGLRDAYVQAHLQHRAPPGCRDTVARLGAHVRGKLPRRERRVVDTHLAECQQCRTLVGELRDVDRRLHGIFLPVAGLPAGVGFLARFGAGTTRVAERAGEIAAGISTPVAVGVAATGVVITGAIGVTMVARQDPAPVVVMAGAPVAGPDGANTNPSLPATTGGGSGARSPGSTVAETPGQDITTTLPGATLPGLTVPGATVPGGVVTVPTVTVPTVTVPSLTVPSLPPISLPAVSLPPVTVPAVSVPIVSTLPAVPQLQVQAGLQGVALPGLEAVLTVSVANAGTGSSQGTLVRLPLPAGLTYVGASGPGWSCGGGSTVTCQLPDVGPGASTTATVRVRVGLLVTGILQLVPVVDASNAVAVTGPALVLAIGG